ncbi:AsmA-like C-terminal region-containing protein [Rufibacter tibetensis]|uniref:AsmA-like C-terminal region-containing protein n=1 Tax=Rufibacter tibetensis TaxID=512763 RepID=UPI0012F814B6|nr:AsmA-like C-terminal region-containing protein [Rufibacter tibetensis]
MVKYFFFAVAGIFLIMALAGGLLYVYQDKIIGLFVAEANQHIKTKVAVEKIEVTWWEQFPEVAIRLQNVEVTEAVPGSKAPLAKLKKVYATFHPWDLWRSTYRIREIHLEDGEVQARVLPNGKVNYRFYQSADTIQNETMGFDLQHISLKNVHVVYQDAPRRQKYDVQAHEFTAALEMEGQVLQLKANGNTHIKTIRIGENEFLREKAITVASKLSIHTGQHLIALQPSEVQIGKAVYQLGGEIGYTNKMQLDLTVNGKNTDVQSILALLPPRYSDRLGQYRSNGDIYFKGKVKGEMSSSKNPFLDVEFGARGASLYHPDYKGKVEKVTLVGRFTNGAQRNSQTSLLELRNIKGTLHGKPFNGEVVYKNFSNPNLQLQLNAQVDLAHVLGLFPSKDLKKGSGQAQVRFAFSGNLHTFKTNPNSPAIQAHGDATLRQVSLLFRQHPMTFTGLNGTLLLNKNNVSVSNFKGQMGDTDILVSGQFKNALAWILFRGQKLRIEADVSSRFLNIDQVLAASSGKAARTPGKKGSAGSYAFNMPAQLELELNTSLNRLKFRRFKGRQLHGRIQLKDKVLSTSGMALQAAGGSFRIRGSMDARRPLIKVTSIANLDNINVDSLFYVFEDFGQTFIMQRHLRGELTAQINSDTYLDHNLSPRTDLVRAEIKTILRNGQLLDFAPMQKLSLFVKRNELSNLRFSEIRNNFYIRNRIVYIPEMEIRSSATRLSSITVSGTHTFDQVMDYHVRLPLKSQRPDKDARFGVIATSSTGNPNLFLTIKGKEGNFKVAYDQQRVRQKVAADLRREKKVIKEIFQGKSPEKKEAKTVKPSTVFFDF